MSERQDARTKPPLEIIQRVREFNALRDRSLVAQSPGAPVDEIELRTMSLQLALHVRDTLTSETPDAKHRAMLRTAFMADQQAFREILRDHAPTPTGHCQRCHLPAPVTFVFYDWPCPTVQLVEQALEVREITPRLRAT